MKVLALAVLLIAVSGLEAGVVKREVPNRDQLTQMFQSWAEIIKSSTQDWVSKVQTQDLQTQVGAYYEQTKAQVEPIMAELEKCLKDIIESTRKAIA
ncbi:hypothetical protein FKM82_016303 [Ascaphus truei]